MSDISPLDARRIALHAMGFTEPRPKGRVDIRHVRKVLRRLRAIQIDSVNVLVRAHYMPMFSRLGPYRMELLDELAYGRKEAFEYWGHEASFLPVDLVPLFRFRMEAERTWRVIRELRKKHPDYIDNIIAEVGRRGPVTVSDLDEPGERTGPWWGYGPGKTALEFLFAKGVLGVQERRNFARVYDVFERTVPAQHHSSPAVGKAEAERQLVMESVAALGIGTYVDIADYFRLRPQDGQAAINALVASGDLQKVTVDGWRHPAYVLAGTNVPRRRSAAAALLTPFDNLIWHRDRTERLFDFHYRIEIYVPEPKRVYGYYVLPFLMDEELVARIDLKADRQAGKLLAKGAWAEDGADRDEVAAKLAGELGLMAAWLGLDDVVVGRKGNLATSLRREL
jgi:uncharacterized protein YcaQ